MFDSIWSLIWTVIVSYSTFRLLKFLYITVYSTYAHFLSKPLDLTPYQAKWTVVTGCTDGIGKAYVRELSASRGIRKYYLIARNPQKLQGVVDELQSEFDGIEVKTAIFDFEKDNLEDLPADLKTLDIGILINCAGTGPPEVGNFAELPAGLPSRIMRVNLLSTLRMIELVLPGMIRRDCGIVVNFGSITGWRPLPYMSTYPASKAAISFYTDTLADEFAHTNVHIQCLIPLLVATKIAFYEEKETNLFVLDSRTYARYAVNIIGRFRLSTGCFLHDMQIAFGTLLSFWLFKQFFVPFVMLGVHKRRVAQFAAKNKAQ